MSEANDFIKLASAMAHMDKHEEGVDESDLNVTHMGDALKALADVAINDPILYHSGWISALKAAQLRAREE